MKNKKIIGGILISTILLISIISFLFAYGNGNIDIPTISGTSNAKIPKYTYECRVIIKDPSIISSIFGADLKIESVSCERLEKCGFLDKLLPFNLFSAEGKVDLIDLDENINLNSKTYKTAMFGGIADVTLSGCSAYGHLSVRLYDDKGNLVDTFNT